MLCTIVIYIFHTLIPRYCHFLESRDQCLKCHGHFCISYSAQHSAFPTVVTEYVFINKLSVLFSLTLYYCFYNQQKLLIVCILWFFFFYNFLHLDPLHKMICELLVTFFKKNKTPFPFSIFRDPQHIVSSPPVM